MKQEIAFVQMFRAKDRLWLAQSSTGGRATKPAWDFQWFVPDFKLGDTYGFVMRAAYLPFEGRAQNEKSTKQHRAVLNAD